MTEEELRVTLDNIAGLYEYKKDYLKKWLESKKTDYYWYRLVRDCEDKIAVAIMQYKQKRDEVLHD